MIKNIKLLILIFIFNISFAIQGAKYLIISPDNFVSALQPLAEWKTKKGIKTAIVPLSVTGNSAYQIKNYIVNAYNNWQLKPEYVLLVGSPNLIPSVNYSGGFYSDDYYGDITGDYRVELCVGRLPCSNLTQCQTNVAKILGYERTPYIADSLWFRKGTGIVREDGTTHPDTIYWNNVRYVCAFWNDYRYVQVDTFSRLRGNNANNVVNAITNGRSYVVYRGEATANWYNPFQVNPNNTNNGWKLPVVVSGTCATITLSPMSPTGYLGDQFLNAGSSTTPKGAVAFFGTTEATTGSGLANLRGTVTKAFFKAIFEERNYYLGNVAKRAKFIVDSLQPPYYNSSRYWEWNLLGDPTMRIWTSTPKPITVQHETIIETRPQIYTVTVRKEGVPVFGANVCLMKDDTTIYQSQTTNNAGMASFSIYPHSIGTMSIIITGPDCVPYEKNVSIRLPTIEHDVGILSIVQPIGTIINGTNVIPKVKVMNFGTRTDTFPVTFKIGNVYEHTMPSIILASGDSTIVEFPIWTAVTGNYDVYAFTALSSDEWRSNDTAFGYINVILTQDVGVDAILSPDSIHPVFQPVVPKVRIKNYGSYLVSNFNVICSIINHQGVLRHTDSKYVSVLYAGDTMRINFNSWSPVTTELCTVKIRCMLVGDQNPNNDRSTRLIWLVSTSSNEDNFNSKLITKLNPPYPSPNYNRNVIISFNLGGNQAGHKVLLRIFDASGRVVKTLVNTSLCSGNYNYIWDGTDNNNLKIPDGIYFCNLEVDQSGFTKKIVLTNK
ncbi:MAG: C25 family cysteine peptidase [candidate division WOR-3 bacterium]|nr:C25 family cysteine peptidase [candidate division WOR-3 bacterium]